MSCFNPRTPGGVRPDPAQVRPILRMFQSTHPGRGATPLSVIPYRGSYCFNPRTPGGVRLFRQLLADVLFRFNPRTPGGVRRHNKSPLCSQRCFNPRTPGGVRHVRDLLQEEAGEFQSTHPGRGATGSHTTLSGSRTVSIHAPRAGCDSIKRKGLKVRVICGTFCERIGVDFL